MIRVHLPLLAVCLLACHADEVAQEPDKAPQLEAPAEPAPGGGGLTAESVFAEGMVATLQRALRERGHAIEVTGELDMPTQDALSRFQGERELARTGLPDAETLRQLDLDPDEWIRTTAETTRDRDAPAPTKEKDGKD